MLLSYLTQIQTASMLELQLPLS